MFGHELALLLQRFVELAALVLLVLPQLLLPLHVLLLHLQKLAVQEGYVVEDLADQLVQKAIIALFRQDLLDDPLDLVLDERHFLGLLVEADYFLKVNDG